tara:strand:+ start:206 stop:973 length:768 start_codon:yes stop_codon:yes gene_type:complete
MKINSVLLVVFFCLSICFSSYSQKSLNDYAYVVISEQFEFQNQKDKYQLNSLAKFLFNKYGFNAFFNAELPASVKRCDGLWVEAEGSPGFIITKIQLVLSDCNGNEVYRTKFGKSKIKDYKKAYYESMREAFDEFVSMDINQKEIENNNLQLKETTLKNPIDYSLTIANLPKSSYTSYTCLNKRFLLRKTTTGYTLYKEEIGANSDLILKGKITIKDSTIIFEDSQQKKLKVEFDEFYNLIIWESNKKIKYIFVK